ncbi:LysR family transcriptional regulator [Sphingomonas sp. JC676]|uniref:LysR family transcriptional regulator n=1 Tax=Sphingomonas sp. JC676 TaxID=2768065 RepID=UPI001657FA9F|nr:LysR family transcriptional regulator [Sphingomonas sp. JC676]MBC9032872.1 LysR family transcriptional regulator [Sphingomonas sp. JC676]
MSQIDWEQQRAFLAAIEEGSLSGAARRLGLAQPTVRVRIEMLENALGTPLFTRSPGGLIPTERGEALREHARAMALASDAFVRSASAAPDQVAGTVRVSASDMIAIEALPPILADLATRHPSLVIELSPTNRNEDVLRREADVAVRMVPPNQDALVARRVGVVALGLHAHPAYLAGREIPRHYADLARHRIIGPASDSPVLRSVQEQGFPVGLADFGFRTDSDIAQYAAIRAGLGIGVCQVPLGKRDGLAHLLPLSFSLDLETWVVCHEDLRNVARVRAVFDALVVGLTAYIAGS